MAIFSLNDLMFGDHGIAYIPGISVGTRARILAEVARNLFEQGHHLGFDDHALGRKQIVNAIERVVYSHRFRL